MTPEDLLPHLFRTEFRKIAAVLCKHFGIEHIAVAEDIASETFLSAFETWPFKGVPVNPVAWLYTVAKNKAKNYINRSQIFSQKVAISLKDMSQAFHESEIDLSEQNITDSQLQMLFAICHPAISVEAQIALSLRILCGFGIDEIANAFLTNKEVINKRLYRARETLRNEKVKIELPTDHQISNRLETVLKTLYLLFSEGYYSETQDDVLREDLCMEAMRLVGLLIENEKTNVRDANALYALMCFHASRFKARRGPSGNMILYDDQDESLWNYDLIAKGGYFLNRASQGSDVTKYHLEATIAYWMTVKADTEEKWNSILQLYNHLLVVAYSPIAALNRTYALSKVKGPREAISEAEKLCLTDNHFYFTLLGELHKDIDKNKSKMYYTKAMALAKTRSDKQTIQEKISLL